MKIFVSWSGGTSKRIAEAIREWLPNVIQAVDPWISYEDIDKGARWYVEIVSGLQNAHFGIICLTSENIESPWIHFEAGALSKSLEKAKVCPYLFQIERSMIKGPLTLFQMAESTKEDTKKLLHSINQSMADKALSSEKLDNAFERWWPDLNEKFEGISKVSTKLAPKRSDRELVEEILEGVRSLLRQTASEESKERLMKSPEFIDKLRGISQFYQDLPQEVRDKIQRIGALE